MRRSRQTDGWLEVVQTVANRAERGLVASAIGRDGPGRVLNRCGGLGEGDYGPSLEQPDQAGLVVAGQPAVARMRRRRRLVEAEQVARGPAERLGLLAPPRHEPTAVLHG